LEYGQEILEIMNQGRYDDARAFANSLIKANPNDIEGWNHRADVESHSGDHALALRYAREASLRFPNEPNPRFQEVSISWDLKRKRDAIRMRKQFERDFPEEKLGIATLNMLEAMKRMKPLKAVRWYREVQKHTEAFDDIESTIAQAEHHSGNFGAAHRSLIAAYRRDPYDAETCADLAENYLMCLKPTKAREMARHVRDLDPSRHGKMTRLIWMSWLIYFPPCWNFAACVTAMTELSARTHWLLALGLFFLFRSMLMLPTTAFLYPMKVIGWQPLVWASLAVAGAMRCCMRLRRLRRWVAG